MCVLTQALFLCLICVAGVACSESATNDNCDSQPKAERIVAWDEKQANGQSPSDSVAKLAAASGTYGWQWAALSGSTETSSLRISITKGDGAPRYTADQTIACARPVLRLPLRLEATTLDGKLVVATAAEGTEAGNTLAVSAPATLGSSQLLLQVDASTPSNPTIVLVKSTSAAAEMGQKFSTEQWGKASDKIGSQ